VLLLLPVALSLAACLYSPRGAALQDGLRLMFDKAAWEGRK
jgi:hypothetical protein